MLDLHSHEKQSETQVSDIFARYCCGSWLRFSDFILNLCRVSKF